MTAAAALQKFFADFMGESGRAYVDTNVPDDVVFPYLTYQYRQGALNDATISMTVYLWFYTESEAVPNAKANELFDLIGRGGVTIRYDDGLIWLTRGTPWCLSVNDTTVKDVRGRYININVEYLTAR